MNRKFGVIILAIIAVLCLSFAACNIGSGSTGGTVMTKEEALKKYIFEHEDSLVSEEFTLPKKIGGYRATWTSDSKYVVLQDRDDDYLATPVLPEEGQVTVNLTVDLRGVSDTYTVRVKAITVQDIADNFTFRQDKQVVYASFDLDLVASYKGRAADITWTVVNGNNISIGEDGDECIVVPSSLNPTVSIKAEFSYKGEVATKVYTFTVSEEMEHLQQVNHWYTNTGVSVTLQGYVVAIADPSYEQFGNISLYIVDEDFCCGYYLYQVVCDKTLGAKIRPGVFVTAEGTVNTLYNGGLYETTQKKGNIVAVDETKTIEMDDPRLVYALDNDVLSGSYATVYNQSRLVSLTNWTVDSVAENVEFTNATLFTLKKGDVKVTVGISKYLKGEYASATDPVYTALYEKYKTIKEGDVVSVTGILGYYKGHQILPLSADDIVIGGNVGENDEVIGKAVKSAIAKVDEAFGKIPAIVAVEGTQSYELPSDNSVEISYRLIGTRTTIALTEADGKKALKFTPDFAEVANIDVTFKMGDYVTHKFYSVRAEKLDDQGKADWEIKNFDVPTEITAAGDVDLPDTSFFENASVVWTSAENFAVVKGTVLTVSLPLTVKVLKLTATVTVGTATATRDYFVKVSAYDAKEPIYVETAPQAGTYLALAIYQENLSKTLYATNQMSGFYIATTEDYTAAARVVLTAVEGGYTIQLGGKYFEIEISGSYKNVKLRDTATEGFAWTWNADNKTFQTTIDEMTLYVGTYNTYNTVSASTIDKIGTSFPARLVSEVQTQTAQDLLDGIVASIPTSATEDFALDFKASYELKEGSNGLELDGLTAKVTQTAADQTATLIVTVTYGKDADGNAIVATTEVVITIPAEKTVVETPAPATGEYVITLYQAKAEKTYYATSTIDKGAFKSTEDVADAARFVVTAVEGGYTITTDGKYVELVLSGTYTNLALVDEATSVWVWNENLGVLTYTFNNKVYYIGTYSTQNSDGSWYNRSTFSVSETYRISGDNAVNVGVTQFPATLVSISESTGGETGCDHDWDDGEVTTSATCTTDGVRTYTCSKCSLTKTEKIDAAGHTDTDNNNVCDVCNADLSTSTDKGTKENPYTVAEALEIAGTLGANEYSANAVYVQGIIKSYSDNKSSNAYQMYIVDINNSASELLVYTCYYTDDVKAAYINDTVIVYGYLQNYSGTTLEITKKDTQNPQFIARTAGTSSISVATTSSDKATVALSANSGLNGSTFTFTVTVTTGYEMVSVKVNGTAVTAVEGVYSGTIAGPTTVLVETKEEGAADQITETLTFIAANRTSHDAQQQTWKSGAIELVNKKGSSTSNVADYTEPARFYKSSSLEISCVGMTKIVFKCSSNDYASSLNNSISGDGLTVSISGSEVTVIFSSKVDTFKIDVLSGQVRVKSLEVSYIAE